MNTATFIKDLDGWRGHAALYRLDPPFTGTGVYDDYSVSGVEYVIVSSVSFDDMDEQGQEYVRVVAAIESTLLPDDVDERIALRGTGDTETKVFVSDSEGRVDVNSMYEFAATTELDHEAALSLLGDGYVIGTSNNSTVTNTIHGLRVRG